MICIKIQGTSQEISNSISNIISSFYQQTSMTPLEVQIEFVDDLYTRRLELAISQNDRIDIVQAKDFITSLNGTMVLPQDKSGIPSILISNLTIDSSSQFLSTIIHELAHIHDFYNFLDFNKVQTFDYISSLPDFDLFYYWTEYHARRLGYYFYRQVRLSGDVRSDEYHIKYIRTTEYPFQFDYLCSQLSEHTNNANLFLYDLMQFLGRFSVWETLYPEIKLIPELSMIDGLYNFLSTHNTFKDFMPDIHLLRYHLDHIFQPNLHI